MTTTEQHSRFAGLFRPRDRRTCSLEVRNVTAIGDDGFPLLDGVSLELEPGSRICLVGSAGGGQAALLSLLVGLRRPDAGSIFLNGLDIEVMSRDSIADTIGLVPNEPWIRTATIAENIAFGLPDVSNHQVEWAARVADVAAFARYLSKGLDAVVGAGAEGGGIVPSAGQCRRIALARALLRNPSILVVEEPTGGLASGDEVLFLDCLDRAAAGRTMIVASHRVTVARRVDRVLVLQDGKLVPYRASSNPGIEAVGRSVTATTSVAGGTSSGHSKLWNIRVPTVQVPATTRAQTRWRSAGRQSRPARAPRPVGRSALPVSEPWGIAPGTLLAPGYVASGLLARSAHTDIWAAWSTGREAPVKVKVPAERPVTYHAYEQLARESRITSRLAHPGMAKAFDVDLDAEMPFAVFEFLDSPSLASVLRRQRAGLDALDVLSLGFELAGALNYLHRKGYAHLNLRPRHIRTRLDTVVISDFGHIRPLGTAIPRGLGSGNGNRGEHHMPAPEQQPGTRVEAAMDIYSLGALMHVAAAGRLATSPTVHGPRLVPFATLLETAPVSLTTVVDRMLSDDPVDRPDAEEILTRFRRVLPEAMDRTRIGDLDARPRLRLVVSNN